MTMRFLKIVANNSWDGERYAALAYISLYRNKSWFPFSVLALAIANFGSRRRARQVS